MTDTAHLDLVKQEKQAHATEILTAIDAALNLLDSRPELWFGGTPETFTTLKNHLTYTGNQLATTFEVEWSRSPPSPTA